MNQYIEKNRNSNFCLGLDIIISKENSNFVKL